MTDGAKGGEGGGSRMISFDVGSCRFDLRAAVVLVRGDDVLLHRAAGDCFWSLPGGRVEAGETAADAAVRELREELDETIHCERLLFVVENFFEHAGARHHEIGLYFEARLDEDSPRLGRGPFEGTEAGRPLHFEWFERSRLGDLDVRPSLLVDVLGARSPTVRHVVHRDPAIRHRAATSAGSGEQAGRADHDR